MRVFKQISNTLSILRNEDVDDDVQVSNANQPVHKWFPLHNNHYIIRDEFAPFPLSGLSVVNVKDFGIFVWGGTSRFGKCADATTAWGVKDIDWISLEMHPWDNNHGDQNSRSSIASPTRTV